MTLDPVGRPGLWAAFYGALRRAKISLASLSPAEMPAMPYSLRVIAGAVSLLLSGFSAASAAPPDAADRIYRNGVIFTADDHNPRAQALAIRDGLIVYVGSDQGVSGFLDSRTESVDLKGRFLMPGIVDGHMHPFEAGAQLLKCNLNYESLTVAEFQQRLQACLDRKKADEPDAWLEVVNWFQETMRPAGITTHRAMLDALSTHRPIIVLSSQGHTGLANSRALGLARITTKTPDPPGGKIRRDAAGEATGLLEETAAFSMVTALLPKPTPAEDEAAAAAALEAMNRQGVTSFLDADANAQSMAAFAALRKSGKLTARAHFAPQIAPAETDALEAAVARVKGFRTQYDEGPIVHAAGLTVRNAKLFLDGIIYVPAFTGAMVDPYLYNAGTATRPRWIPGPSRGPAVYFPPPILSRALVSLGRAGIDPHMHADGDGAVRAALDAIPVLSFQWEQPAGYTLGLKDYFGPARMKILEPAGVLAAAGARIAFGSDWPVDPLDEWFAFKVGVMRTGTSDAPAEYRGRLGTDPGLSRAAVLRAATIDAAYELHEDDVTGSLALGKLADLIVLDRNPRTVPGEQIASIRVLET